MGGLLSRLWSRWRPTPPVRPPGYLTWAEVEARHPGEWVLLDQPTVDRYDRVTGGQLLVHHPDRDEFEAMYPALPRPFHVAVRYVRDPNRPEPEFLMIPHEVVWLERLTQRSGSSSSTPG